MGKKFVYTINIFAFILILLAVELVIWLQENQTLRNLGDISKQEKNIPFHSGIKKFQLNLETFPEKTQEYEYGRQPEGLEYSKKPIVIFGCSYVFGHKLEREQTFSYKLAHRAKAPVYNRGFSGWGIQHMLYQVKQDTFYKKVPEPSHAIFLYIPDHLNRLYFYSFGSFDTLLEKQNLRYTEKNENLIEVSNKNFLANQLKRLYITNKINQYLTYKKTGNIKTNKECYHFALKHFLTARDEMQKRWKNTQYIVIFYTATENDTYFKELLSNNGFTVIDANELTNQNLWDNKYMRNDFHPNEEAWNIVVPQLIKKLGV